MNIITYILQYVLHLMWMVSPRYKYRNRSNCLSDIDTNVHDTILIHALYAGISPATNFYALMVTNMYNFLRYQLLHVLMFFLVKYKYQKQYSIALKFTKCCNNGMCIYSLHTYKQNFARNIFLQMIPVVVSRLLQQQQRNDSVRPTQSNVQVQATNLNSSTLIDGELMFTAGLIIHLTFDSFIQHQVPFYYDVIGLPFGFIYDDINDSKILLFRLLH